MKGHRAGGMAGKLCWRGRSWGRGAASDEKPMFEKEEPVLEAEAWGKAVEDAGESPWPAGHQGAGEEVEGDDAAANPCRPG